MISPFAFVLKSLLLKIFSTTFLAIFVRTIIFFFLSFFILPAFFIELTGPVLKLQLFILFVILSELIAYKVQQNFLDTSVNTGDQIARKPQTNFVIHNIHEIIKKPHLSLFLYTKTVDIEGFIPKSIYSAVISDDFLQNTIKIFDHYKKPIIAVEIESCTQILKNLRVYPLLAKIFNKLKKNEAQTISFILGVQDLCDKELKKDSFNKLENCISMLNAHFNKRLNIDLILENMQAFTGFPLFSMFVQSEGLNLLTISLCINPSNTDSVLEIFEQKFTNFSLTLDHIRVTTNFENPIDAQLFQIFSQQILYLQSAIKELVLVVIKISSSKRIIGNKNIFLDIHFMSSTTKVVKKIDIVPKDLQLCIKA